MLLAENTAASWRATTKLGHSRSWCVCVCVCVCLLHITHVVRDKNCHSKPFVTVYDCHNIIISHYHCILAEQMELTNISLAASFFLVAMSFLNIAALWWTLVEISFLRSISFLPSYSAGMDFANRFSALSLDATDREIETAIIKTFSLLHSLLPHFSQHHQRMCLLGCLVHCLPLFWCTVVSDMWSTFNWSKQLYTVQGYTPLHL